MSRPARAGTPIRACYEAERHSLRMTRVRTALLALLLAAGLLAASGPAAAESGVTWEGGVVEEPAAQSTGITWE